MKYFVFASFILFYSVAVGQVKKVPVTQVNTWNHGDAATSFSGKQGGRYTINERLRSQYLIFQNSLHTYKVYPNPSSGLVKLQGAFLPTSIAVYNAQGIFVEHVKVKLIDSQNAVFELTDFPPGLYFLQSEGFTSIRLQLY